MREIARQSFLVAARDELGLQTRDASLGDEMPKVTARNGVPTNSDNPSFDLLTASFDEIFLEVRRGEVSKTVLLHRLLHTVPRAPKDSSKDRFASMDYRAWLAEMEEFPAAGLSRR